MPATRIQLLLRDDYPQKSGGDLVLAREYESALTEAGHPARLEQLKAIETPGAGAAHLFNVDRYFEFTAAAGELRRAGRRYAVSPVHHPLRYVNHFESDVRSGALGLIAKVGRTPYGRERIKHMVRGRNGRSLVESLRAHPRAAVAEALEGASLIVVQAPTESDELERTFGAAVRAKSAWVPNGVTFDAESEAAEARDIDVLVAGRIEERKNQLNIAQALAGTPWQVTFVGGDNARNAAYAARFHQTIAEHANLRHLPHVSLPELRGLYARSKVFLSASYFEVVSLAELEAVAYGCQLVSTTSGYMRDYLGAAASYIEPTSPPEGVRDAVASASSKGVNEDGSALVRNSYSWSASHRALVEAYDTAGLFDV